MLRKEGFFFGRITRVREKRERREREREEREEREERKVHVRVSESRLRVKAQRDAYSKPTYE